MPRDADPAKPDYKTALREAICEAAHGMLKHQALAEETPMWDEVAGLKIIDVAKKADHAKVAEASFMKILAGQAYNICTGPGPGQYRAEKLLDLISDPMPAPATNGLTRP